MERRRVMVSALAAAIVLGGCGGAEARPDTATMERGDADAAPSMLSLPSADVPEEDLSEHMRFGWTLAAEAISLPMPPPPPDGSTRGLSQWADGDLQTWVERKSHTVESARRELDAAAEESHRQRIMAGAIVGLIYEDVARALLSIPLPAELTADREIADVFREVRQSQASPFLEHARRAYRACAANAAGGAESMAHWAPYCADRAWGLPEGL